MSTVTVEGAIAAVLSLMLTIINVVLLVYFYRNLYCIPKQNGSSTDTSNKKFTITSTIIITCFSFAITMRGIANVIYLSGNDSWQGFYNYTSIFWVLGILGIVLVFIFRVVYTFTGSLSIFAYSSTTIKALYISFIISILYVPIGIGILYSGSNILLAIFTLIFMIHYYTNYILCFILFIKKIVVIINYKMDNYNKQDAELEPQGLYLYLLILWRFIYS